MPPFEEERTFCFAPVCRSVRLTFSFRINNSSTPWPSSNLVHTSIWAAEEPYWNWDHWVKGQGHQGQMCQNHFWSITRERLDLPSSNLSQTSILVSKGTLLIWGQRSQGSNLPKLWFTSSYIFETYFKLTNPVVQNICDKNTLGGIMFLQTCLVY